MGVFVPMVNGAQAEVVGTLGSAPVVNRLWFLFDNPPFTPTDLQGLSDGLADWWSDEVLPYLSSDYFCAQTRASDWTSFPPPASAFTIVNQNGGVSEKSYSANVAIRINLRWPLSIRERMNCNFLGGIPDSAISLNQVDGFYAHRYWDAYVSLIDRCRLFSPLFNWRWMVASSYDNGAARTVQRVGECIGPVNVNKLTLAQRRRRLS